jgi:hypothetical protein
MDFHPVHTAKSLILSIQASQVVEWSANYQKRQRQSLHDKKFGFHWQGVSFGSYFAKNKGANTAYSDIDACCKLLLFN